VKFRAGALRCAKRTKKTSGTGRIMTANEKSLLCYRLFSLTDFSNPGLSDLLRAGDDGGDQPVDGGVVHQHRDVQADTALEQFAGLRPQLF